MKGRQFSEAMRPTRLFWVISLLGGFLALYGVVLSQVVLVLAAAGVGAWLVVAQYQAVRDFAGADDALTVSVTLTQQRVLVEGTVHVSVTATLDEPQNSVCVLTAPLPVGASGDTTAARRITISPGQTRAETTFSMSLPVAGQFTLPAVSIDYSDERELISQHVDRPVETTVTAEPRRPRNVHVGQSGERISQSYGEHETGHTGSGISPAELRQYVPGDLTHRIDWKATARLGEPYVREFEQEASRQTLLVCDHRAAMDIGPEGETMFEYTRAVALGFLESAQDLTDPLGLYALGNAELTERIEPTTTPAGYRTIRTALLRLQPTSGHGDPQVASRGDPKPPDKAQAAATTLEGDDSSFATRLRPFFAESTGYVKRLRKDSLFEAIREQRSRLSGSVWTVLLTSDEDRRQIREAVRLAREGDNHVLVFLTPKCLYESRSPGTIEDTYEKYLAFEEFRKQLDRLPRVTAFEVAPGDRLDAVLTARRTGQAEP